MGKWHTRSLSRLLAALLILCMTWTSSAQQAPSLSKKAEGAKQKIESLAPNAEITVIPLHGQKEYGSIVSHDEQSFTLYDLDLKANVVLKYAEVKKVKDGYGGRSSFAAKHPQVKKGVIVAVVILG